MEHCLAKQLIDGGLVLGQAVELVKALLDAEPLIER
jgi:hypothetical protein